MKRILTALILALCFASNAFAQTARNKSQERRDRAQQTEDARETTTREMIQKAAESPDAKKLQISVRDNVDASAVLIPARDASRIFGPQIGQNYAVVEINVGNKSPDATFIIHSVFIDYKRWGLSGAAPGDGESQDDDAAGPDHFAQYQSQNRSTQVASEEYRIVRGEFLNAQTWRKRSWAMRLLTLAGNVAGAYTFSLNEQGIIKGIAAFNGVVVPGINTAWPDTSQDQVHRIDDLGFRTNKVVPKQAAEIIVCFFPIDRFLTPGFRKLFLKAPSLSFAPGLLLLDKTIKNDVVKVLGDDLGVTPETLGETTAEGVFKSLKEKMPCYMNILQAAQVSSHKEKTVYGEMKQMGLDTCLYGFGLKREFDHAGNFTGLRPDISTDPKVAGEQFIGFKTFMALDHISQISLNKMIITIDGSMTVDTTALAANIDSVTFDDVTGCAGTDSPCFWSPLVAGGVRTGTISGAYLTDGKVSITGTGDVEVGEVTTVSEGSSDQRLRFSYKLTKGASNGGLAFKVTKQSRDSDKPITSQPFVLNITGPGQSSGLPPPHPSVTNVTRKDASTLVVEGSDFFSSQTYPLAVMLHNEANGDDVTVEPSSVTFKPEGKGLEVKIPNDASAAGCWRLTVKVGELPGQPPLNNGFTVAPTVSSVTRDGNNIVVAGEGLDALTCGGKPVTVTLINGDTKLKLGKPTLTPTSATFALTTEATKKADNTWTAQVQFDGKDVNDSPFNLAVKSQP